MKILIMGFSKIKYMPYMNFYLENINADKNDVHLLYWNRDLKPEDVSALAILSCMNFPDFRLTMFQSFLKSAVLLNTVNLH